MNTAVLLIGFGAPENKYEIRDFLYNIFRDPYIYKIPIAQDLISKIISLTRVKLVSKKYEKIGGGSPYNSLTFTQANLLQDLLQKKNDFKIFIAFQYHKPFIEGVLEEIINANFLKIIVFPLYPQFSTTTTGSALKRVDDFVKKNSPQARFLYIKDFHNNEVYINALTKQLRETLHLNLPYEDFYILFSAHGIPMNAIRNGDPYSLQVETTVKKVMEKLDYKISYSISYQSKVGYGKWLTPDTKETIRKLFYQGVRKIIVVPVSFICEHYETLYQIDFEFKNFAINLGYKKFVMMKALNDNPELVRSLADIILDAEKKLNE